MARTKTFDEAEVLDKAVDIFRRKGYRATSPEDLVIHLGISRSSLYDTYGDKRTLFIKALTRYQEATSKALHDIADGASDALEGIKGIFELTLNGCFEDTMPQGCFLVNSIVEFGAEDMETTGIVQASMNDNRNTLLHLIERGQQNGQLNNNLKAGALADFLVNNLSGISISSKAGTGREACEAIAQNAIAILAA